MSVERASLAKPPNPTSSPSPTHAGSRPDFASSLAIHGGRTPMSGGEAARHLATAWQQVTGQPPSERTLGALWAQWALETGRGKSMHGYNFGGLKGAGPEGGSAVLRTREGFGSSEQQIKSRFRTYSTPEQGALDYVRTLHERYPEATRAAAEGNATGFVAGLRQRGYFTGDPASYQRAIEKLSVEHARGADFSQLKDPGPLVDALLHTLSRAIYRRRA
ncbi:MAG: glucosaminidase domain-containing protein [Polyangiaceae bacterium]|nr:glucosaminidase domain-containing protein [Polyangiaceae bacterium]MCW5792372.1 glucosaminidase domain-containing protein [Polyangiaceae bacterium]